MVVAFPTYWVLSILELPESWRTALMVGIGVSALSDRTSERFPALSARWWRVIISAALIAIPLIASLDATRTHPITAILFALTLLALLGLSIIYPRPDAVMSLGMAAFGVVLTLVLANVMAVFAIRVLDNPPEQQSPPPTTEPSEEPTINTTPGPRPTPNATPLPETPVEAQGDLPDAPIAGWGYMDFIVDNGEAPWTYLTGYGPRVNSQVRAYMLDADGELVYDVIVDYNGKGMRGPEVDYEKPDDVYRILIIGDSFVEAIQVPYEQTFPALLQEQLAAHDTADRRYEVIAMGRTGWGPLHEYIYYDAEGRLFGADLVLVTFYINDVADTYPIVFYPDINNTNFEFVFEGGDTVRLIDTNEQALAPNPARLLYNALPPILQERALARLFVRLGDPAIPVITPGGVMTRVHPQYYIYVEQPDIEGYPEAWDRTAQAMDLFARNVDRAGGRFAVTSIFIGEGEIMNVAGWFPELVAGYQWNADLPDQRLQAILDAAGGDLIRTRPTFDAYAESVGGSVHDLLFLREDGHFNPTGHVLTAEAIYGWLVDEGIVR